MVYLAAADMLNGVVTLLAHPDARYVLAGARGSPYAVPAVMVCG